MQTHIESVSVESLLQELGWWDAIAYHQLPSRSPAFLSFRDRPSPGLAAGDRYETPNSNDSLELAIAAQ